MKWERGDKYHIRAPGWAICRINIGEQRIYELWNTATKECMGSGKATNDVEAQRVIEHLKGVAGGV